MTLPVFFNFKLTLHVLVVKEIVARVGGNFEFVESFMILHTPNLIIGVDKESILLECRGKDGISRQRCLCAGEHVDITLRCSQSEV
jgi:hypothetical protein